MPYPDPDTGAQTQIATTWIGSPPCSAQADPASCACMTSPLPPSRRAGAACKADASVLCRRLFAAWASQCSLRQGRPERSCIQNRTTNTVRRQHSASTRHTAGMSAVVPSRPRAASVGATTAATSISSAPTTISSAPTTISSAPTTIMPWPFRKWNDTEGPGEPVGLPSLKPPIPPSAQATGVAGSRRVRPART
jgi:hypothetical protein